MFSWLTTQHFQRRDINYKNSNLQLIVIHSSSAVQCFMERTEGLQKVNGKKKDLCEESSNGSCTFGVNLLSPLEFFFDSCFLSILLSIMD